jgi:hypothetical protein
VHLARRSLTAHSSPQPTGLRAARRAAILAALRLVLKTFLLIELLLTSREHKVLAAFAALESFVCEAQL